MPKNKNHLKAALKDGGSAVLPLLKTIDAASGVFPPLKSAVSIALVIGNMVDGFQTNKKDWSKFGQFVQEALSCVVRSLPNANEPCEDLKSHLKKLEDTFQRTQAQIVALQAKQLHVRFWNFFKDPDEIIRMRKEIEEAIGLFQLGSMVSTSLGVAEILEWVKDKLSDKIVQHIALSALPYAEGASWDSSRVCLPGTRVEILDDIWTWANDIKRSSSAQIFWLADVAGAGKSSIAHSFCQRCHRHGILASSFFFDRETAGRNSPQKLFSTIARDLASIGDKFAEHLGMAVERDPSLPTAGITRQFDGLILGSSDFLATYKLIVIVIDALDEGYNHNNDLLIILANKISLLPRNFRFLLTSRAEEDIERFLHGKPHIERRSMGIQGQSNKADVAAYTSHRLEEIAMIRALPANWPQEDLKIAFIRKSEGLFIWAATVCDFLALQIDPSRHLNALLSNHGTSGLRAEVKMDKLYSTILSTCNWEDDDFVRGYTLLVGTIMAAKIPLSASALQSFHHTSLTVRVVDVLRPLGSLLAGLTDEFEPIRILHLSFRDFLTVRARSSFDGARYYVNEKEHSQRLALMCLVAMNKGLKRDICGIEDLTVRTSEIEDIAETVRKCVTEHLWYACRFWTEHVAHVEGPVSDQFVDMLKKVLLTHLLPWMEVMALKEVLGDATNMLITLRNWLQRTLPDETHLAVLVSDGLRLVQQFSVVIMQNPLHIYASALPFTPIASAIRNAYLPLFLGLPRVVTGLHENWSSVLSIFGGRSQSYGQGSVRSIAFSVDGSRIAVGSDDHIVRLWYHQSGTYFELKQHTAGVTSVAFSLDGAMIASSSHDGLACIWDATANTTSPVHILRTDDIDHSTHSLTSVAFSQDSQLVASGSSVGPIYVWDLSVNPPSERQLSKHTSWICSLVFINDCSRMTSCSIDGRVCIWDTQTWDCIHQPRDRHLYGVNFVALSSDGSRIAICFVDGSLKFEDIEYGSDAPLLASSGPVSVAISPDRNLGVSYSNDCSPLFSGFYNQMSVNDTSAAQKPISFVAFSPISDHLSARCTDGTIHLYSPPANRHNRPTSQVICTDAGPAGPVVFADDGSQIAFSTSDGSIYTRDLTNERVRSVPFATAGHMPLVLSFSPDKTYISALCVDGNFRVWNIETGTITCEFLNGSDWVNIVVFSPYQSWIAIGSSIGTCFVYNYMEGRCISRITLNGKGAIVQINFSEDQQVHLLTIDGQKCSVDVISGDLRSTVVGRSFCGTVYVAFSPDGSKVASASATGQVTMWDSLTGHPIKRFISRGREAMVAVTFSGDSCRIGAGSSEGIARVWEINDQHLENIGEDSSDTITDTITSARVACGGNRIAVIRDNDMLLLYHSNNLSHPISILPGVGQYQFSPDGNLLASRSFTNGHLLIQKTENGLLISDSPVDDGLGHFLLEFSPNSRHIVTVDNMDNMQVWHADTDFKEGHNLGRSSTAANNDKEREMAKATGTATTMAPHWHADVRFTTDSSRILDYSASLLRILEMDGSVLYEGYSTYPPTCGSHIIQLTVDNIIQVLDVCTLSVVYEGDEAHYMDHIVLSPDGSLVAGSIYSMGNNSSSIRVWKLNAGRAVCSTLAGHDEHGNFYALGLDTGNLVAQDRYPVDKYSPGPDPYLDHFIRRLSNTDDTSYARSEYIPMDDEGWIRTRDLKRTLWIPFDYRGKADASGHTAVICTLDRRLVVIRAGDL